MKHLVKISLMAFFLVLFFSIRSNSYPGPLIVLNSPTAPQSVSSSYTVTILDEITFGGGGGNCPFHVYSIHDSEARGWRATIYKNGVAILYKYPMGWTRTGEYDVDYSFGAEAGDVITLNISYALEQTDSKAIGKIESNKSVSSGDATLYLEYGEI